LPAETVELLATARAARKACEGAARLPASPAAQATARATMLNTARLAQKSLARAVLKAEADDAAAIASLRAPDPHAFSRLATASRDGTPTIPDGDTPANIVFPQFGAKLYGPTPTPPAATESSPWLEHVPRPSSSEPHTTLARPLHWTEVYLAMYGATGIPTSFASDFSPCRADCGPCGEFCRDLNAYEDGAPHPTWRNSSLHTSSACGSDGVRAELLRWFRVNSGPSTYQVRMRIAITTAIALNKIDTDGLLGNDSVSLVYPLLRATKAGMVHSLADPASYRFIAVSTVLSKTLAIVLSTRLEHFAEANKLLPEEQCGFRRRQGAEHHVWTLKSLLHTRRRSNLSSYVLYIDFEKAFDRVNPVALECSLRTMGIPESFLHLLRTWRNSRTVSIVVNGSRTPAFPVLSGVPQGCPLSPLLFNLFIASLSIYLESIPGLTGASALGVTIKRLGYADDFALLAASPAELQLALQHLQLWAEAWGLGVNIGPGKTAAECFPAAGDASLTPPLYFNGIVVPWVSEYCYLGAILRTDLSPEAITSRAILAAEHQMRSLFIERPAIRRLPIASQLQLLRGHILGVLEYLRSIALPSQDLYARFDKTVLVALRGILRLPKGTANDLVWGLSGLLPSKYLSMRAWTRLFLQLSNAPFQSPATRFFRALLNEPYSPPICAGPDANWVHCVAAAFTTLPHAILRNSIRQIRLHPPPYDQLSSHASLLARAHAQYDLNARQQRVRLRESAPLTAARQPMHGSNRHAVTLFNTRLTPEVAVFNLGGKPSDNFLSSSGIGLRSVISMLTLTRPPHALIAACLGSHALLFYPYARLPENFRKLKPSRRSRTQAAKPRGDAGPAPLATKDAYVRKLCRLCGAAAAQPEDIYHLTISCPHLAKPRAAIHASLPSLAGYLLQSVRDSYTRRGKILEAFSGEELAALEAFISGAPLPVPEQSFITYRLLLAAPWPSSLARRHNYLTGVGLGCVFDFALASHLRRMCNSWANWSNNHLHAIAQTWQAACRELESRNAAEALAADIDADGAALEAAPGLVQ
jgi:hypothetical protein